MSTTDYIICRGGRTGKKLHAAHPGSSVLNCGHWLKVAANHFKVADLTPERKKYYAESKAHVLCEKCFPPRFF